ncbi:ABC transporter ATP-binding protein [Thermomonas sp.]|uniref:ABC transporter ATP-binding protein n=1 Tax=Thermomonas sp. TaxID=1971895 RepID=UPI002487C50E|nr:ABC transporter ATP-binding protein [Thermomonas sp.]MDI1252828.1 ABC transporter ATP-binding protein [Thermomonas sp.]
MNAAAIVAETMPALVAEGISKAFVSGNIRTSALERISLQIHAGELTLIAGPSGCGKSTLLSVLSGLQRPDSGRVFALSEELGLLDLRALERFRLRHTGFVFQGFNLFPALQVSEQVELPLQYMGVSSVEAKLRSHEALEEVGMLARRHLRPIELSGGEKQRVAIARALAKQPALLFADEPTSSLDAANGQIVIDMLHGIARRHGTTVLCVSHDPRLMTHADRVLHMEDGRILDDRRIAASTATAIPEPWSSTR